MSQATLEQRIAKVEEAVRQLQQTLNERNPSPDWLDKVIGSMKGESAFDEVLAHGRAIRQADRPDGDEGA